MPVFNGERYLAEAIKSIQRQSFTDWELLVIDDGSSDRSAAIVSQFSIRDHRVRGIYKANSGLTDTLNLGLSIARGKWLARMDQDDLAAKNRISSQLKAVKERNPLVLVGSNFSTITAETKSIRHYRLPTTHRSLVKRLQTMRGFFPHSSALFEVRKAISVGGYDREALFNEDWDLWLRLSEMGEIGSVPKDLVTIRKHGDQMTKNSGEISPIAEAFVSTVIHHMRHSRRTDINQDEIRRGEIRGQVLVSRHFHHFFEISDFQKVVVEKTFDFRQARSILKLLVTPIQLIRLIRFVMVGTKSPRKVANLIVEELISKKRYDRSSR